MTQLPKLEPMVSYAQNFEDVILRRALSDVRIGFYVDLGGFDPVVDSVTKWFYDCGWCGIDVEPNPTFFRRLQLARSRNTVLNVAVDDVSGEVEMRLLDGLSTIRDDVAERHARDGRDTSRVHRVRTMTLGEVFDHVHPTTEIDFLKIDVEGAEQAVLAGYDFVARRPRIIVVEATVPNETERAWDAWEARLIGQGYEFAYFDGLNRFYVRSEDGWRKNLLATPPNVFDRFVLPVSSGRVAVVTELDMHATDFIWSGIGGVVQEREALAAQMVRDGEAARGREEQLKADCAQAAADLASLKADAARLRDEFDGARQHAQRIGLERDALQAAAAAAEQIVATLRGECEAKGRDLDAMTVAAHRAAIVKRSLEEKVLDIGEASDRARQRFDALTRDLAAVRGRLRAVLGEAETSDGDEGDAEVEALRRDSDRLSDEVLALRAIVRRYRTSLPHRILDLVFRHADKDAARA